MSAHTAVLLHRFSVIYFYFIPNDYKTFSLAKAYGLNAIVPPNTSIANYIFKGLSGGFKTKIISNKFYKFIAKYKGIEDRDMYIFKLKRNIKESLFQEILFHHDKGDVPYYFTGYNCTTFIREVIDTVHHTGRPREDYPYLLIRDLLDNDLIELVQHKESRLTSLNNSYKTLENSSKKKVRKIINKIQLYDNFKEYKDLTEPEKTFFIQYYDYKSANLEKLDKLKKYLKLADKSLKYELQHFNLSKISKKFSNAHSPRLLGVSFSHNRKKEILYRHSLHDQQEGQFLHNYHDSFNIISLKTEINKNKIKIRRAYFLDHLSVSEFNFLTKNLSTYFSTFYENFTVKRYIRKSLGFKLGTGISTLSTKFKFSTLAVSSLERHTKMSDIFIGGISFFTYPISTRFTFNGTVEYKKNIRKKSVKLIEASLKGIYKIARDLSFVIETKSIDINNSHESTHGFSLYFYF